MRELIDRARNGDHDAYTRLISTRVDRLHATAFLIMRDRPSAEDAVQETCLKAWRDLRGLREPDRYDAWLRRLLVRTCLDHLRRRRRRPYEVELTHLHEERTDDHSRHVADREELARAFRALSPDHRAVVVLAHYEELPMTEIADALHIPVGTVKSRLHRALGLLRAAIEADARLPAGPGGEPA